MPPSLVHGGSSENSIGLPSSEWVTSDDAEQ
jgi:hypothetical protein